MTTYYVRKTGSDAAAGTSAGAAWLTIGKALGAAGIASGDTVYIGAGTYREVVTVAMTSAVAETKVIGDVDGAQTGDPGEVIWSAFTTNDTTAPGTRCLALAARDFLTFEKLTFVAGGTTANIVDATSSNSVNITFNDCTFLGNGVGGAMNMVAYNGAADVAANWTFDRCRFLGAGSNVLLATLPTSASADYDSNIVFRNCFVAGLARLVDVTASGALSFKAGGVDVLNCTLIGALILRTNSANLSTSIPCTVLNSIALGHATNCLEANASGQITEDYNRLIGTGAARLNVTAGGNSISNGSVAPLVSAGQEAVVGSRLRPIGSPLADSPYLGVGGTSPPAVDLLNLPRPEGGPITAALGALERHNTGAQETTTVRTGSSALKITGPGSQDFELPVNASSTTVTVYGRYDANHAATNKPQMKVVNGGQVGVADATDDMTAAIDTWEQLSLTFTPNAKGIVTVRVVSRSAAANGVAFFDDFDVS